MYKFLEKPNLSRLFQEEIKTRITLYLLKQFLHSNQSNILAQIVLLMISIKHLKRKQYQSYRNKREGNISQLLLAEIISKYPS